MCTRNEFLARMNEEFLATLNEPHMYRDRADQLMRTMDDPRCAGAATCPFHRVPGQQWKAPNETAPWDAEK